MRFLIVLSAVLLAQSAAFGQTCANGQCAIPGRVVTQPALQNAPPARFVTQPALQPQRTGLFARVHDRRAARGALFVR